MPSGNQTWQWVDLSVSIWPSLAGRCGDFPPRRETCQNTCRGTSFSGGAGRSSWVPRCVAKGSCFILGLWGWTCVRSTLLLCLRSQPPAVRARWGHCGDPMAVPIATAAKVVTSGGFKRRAMSFRVAGVGLCDIPTCFIACRKSFCVTGTILFRRGLSFFVPGTALWRPPCLFCVACAAL